MKGIFGEEVYVVGDYHDVAHTEFLVHSAGSIAYEKGIDAEGFHHAHREGHLLHIIAFIVVETSLHGHDRLAAEFAEYQVARMALNGGYGEVRNLGVGDFHLASDMVHECAKAGSEDNGRAGHRTYFVFDIVSCLLDFFNHFGYEVLILL